MSTDIKGETESWHLKPCQQRVANNQEHICFVCGQSIHNGEAVNLHHKDEA